MVVSTQNGHSQIAAGPGTDWLTAQTDLNFAPRHLGTYHGGKVVNTKLSRVTQCSLANSREHYYAYLRKYVTVSGGVRLRCQCQLHDQQDHSHIKYAHPQATPNYIDQLAVEWDLQKQ